MKTLHAARRGELWDVSQRPCVMPMKPGRGAPARWFSSGY